MDNISLSAYLDADHISLLPNISSKKRVFDVLGELLAKNVHGLQATQVSENLMARERLGTTALGEGVAIPHCRIDGITKIHSAVIKLDKPVDFDSPDNIDVSIIVALLVPTEATDAHLKLLGHLAELLSKPKNREELRNCESAQELYDFFASTSDKHAA
ncbi:MAG: PTS sugar transporter subunit IIA [Pseudomonadota bacterium]